MVAESRSPRDWKAERLGKLGGWLSGGTPSMANGDYWGGQIPWVSPKDMKRSRLWDSIDHVTAKALGNGTRLAPAHSLLLVVRGMILAHSFPVARAEVTLAFNQDIKAVVPRDDVDSEYLLWWLTAHESELLGITTESTHGTKRMPTDALHAVEIDLPPVPEQRAIAAALSDVDALLGGLDRLIAKKRDLKQAAMQQLLTGQTRLPGFRGEWEVKTLFELAERKKELFDDGDWIESEHIMTEGIRLIQTGNIGIGSFMEKDDKKYINEASFTSLRCKQLKQGDLLVCRLADPAGRACVLGDIGESRIVTSVDVTIFRPPSELADRLFLSQVFSTADWFRAVSDRSGGTTHKRISRGALGRLSINLPPLPEQTAIAAVLSDMDTELAALEARRAKTRDLKQAMMQELLTGRTRLVKPEAAHA